MQKLLSIIISNRNDTTMLSVTIRSCIESFRPLGIENCEIVIVDNSDKEYKPLLNSVIPAGYIKDGTIQLHHQPFPCLFTARDLAAEKSKGKYILCLDSHMICGHNMVYDLVQFAESMSSDSTFGFAHAPINWAHQHHSRSRHDRDMTKHELGPWGNVYTEPKTITWKGMPWLCRRNFFLSRVNGIGGYGALSQHKLSWGGGDMHIGIKPWLLGFKNYAVPTSPGIHIGPFPKIDQIPGEPHSVIVGKSATMDKYRLYSASGNGPHTLGFLVSCYVLGGEPMMERNKHMLKERFGRYLNAESHWTQAIGYGKDEKAWLDENKKMTFEQLTTTKPWNQQCQSPTIVT